MIDHRHDCESFEPKRWPHDCKDCQTDGHYLCSGCRHIASFDDMELSDNRMRYYPKEEKQRELELEELEKARDMLMDEEDSDLTPNPA